MDGWIDRYKDRYMRYVICIYIYTPIHEVLRFSPSKSSLTSRPYRWSVRTGHRVEVCGRRHGGSRQGGSHPRAALQFAELEFCKKTKSDLGNTDHYHSIPPFRWRLQRISFHQCWPRPGMIRLRLRESYGFALAVDSEDLD